MYVMYILKEPEDQMEISSKQKEAMRTNLNQKSVEDLSIEKDAVTLKIIDQVKVSLNKRFNIDIKKSKTCHLI